MNRVWVYFALDAILMAMAVAMVIFGIVDIYIGIAFVLYYTTGILTGFRIRRNDGPRRNGS